ncbi:hypothetical protein [Silvibacterium sp.]|uniref:hypothetical protein n=1 Tax=Silvibacterium sp. TaxID=1964179 RepID=UPI0039E4E6E8
MPVETFFSNLSPASKALQQACAAVGLQPGGKQAADADLILFEATEAVAKSLEVQSAGALINRVRTGGRLLFTFRTFPGHTALWFSEALPSTGWTSQQRPSPHAPHDPTPVTVSDPAFFHGADLQGLAAPLGVDIRPVSAVERGQARYERYRLQHPVTGVDVAPNTDLWSRPLLNREWKVRASYSDLARSPLLVTGRYGAGRVAMLATSVVALGESAAAQAFWRGVVSWLAADEAVPSRLPVVKPSLAMSFPSPGAVRLTIDNPSHEALPVQLVMRVVDRDGAMLADGAGELQKPLSLPAGRPTVLDLPLPAPTLQGLEWNEAESSLLVRAGLLSADGSSLLVEERTPSPSPVLRVRVETDNLYHVPPPFSGPDADTMDGFRSRMGTPVGAYAYRPGDTVHGNVKLSFQCRNLAPYAKVQDLAQPDNASVVALNDRGATFRRPPIDHIQGYGTWSGKPGVENALRFTLPEKARISAVTLLGSYGGYAAAELHNPGSAVVELDGRQVAAVDDLDAAFTKGMGQARITLPPASTGSVMTVRMPWVATRAGHPRQEPQLGEVGIEGWDTAVQPAAVSLQGRLTVALVDALSGQSLKVLSRQMILHAGDTPQQDFSVSLPHAAAPGVHRLEAVFHPAGEEHPVTGSSPVLSIVPRKTLKSIDEINGPGVLGTGMIVTRGFAQFIPLGTGTSEPLGGWSHPDDLIWAYSRQFKEIRPHARTEANRLYATETNMQHYSIPWREFGNGEMFFETCVSGLVRYMKAQGGWATSPLIRVTFADRWVLGPDINSCNSWQEYVAFDSYLRQNSGKGLSGRTHAEVESSIHADHEDQWQAWQLTRYVDAVRCIRGAFQAAGKEVVLYGQSLPVVAGAAGRELAKTIRGLNDDITWGMESNSPTLTTGRTLASLAFNPVWQINGLVAWGFVSSVFNNWQWHVPIGTTEPQRRMLYGYLWRGLVWDGGTYGGAVSYGFGDNVGTSYVLTAGEYQQWWYLQQRGNLLQPESPLGAGLVISTQKNADPRSIRWNGNDPSAVAEIPLLMEAFRSLAEAGISVPFSTNASTLAAWKPTPGASLIVLNLQDFSPVELAGLARVQAQGVRVAVLARRKDLPPAAAALLAHPNTLLLETPATGLTHPQALQLAAQLIPALEVPIIFSEGFTGYGFRCQDLKLIVVEDWREQARMATVRLRKSPGMRHASAANLNDHSTLTVSDAGAFWAISVPMRSGDGALIAVREA